MTSIIKVLAIATSLVTGTLVATGSASAGADSPFIRISSRTQAFPIHRLALEAGSRLPTDWAIKGIGAPSHCARGFSLSNQQGIGYALGDYVCTSRSRAFSFGRGASEGANAVRRVRTHLWLPVVRARLSPDLSSPTTDRMHTDPLDG